MRYLVTGASGRVGRRTICRLQDEGYAVRALVLPDDPQASWLESRSVEMIEGTLLDAHVLRRATRDVDWIVHLAAVMDWSAEAAHTTFAPNVGGTVNLLQAVVDGGATTRRILIASSDEVYPSLKARELPIPETHPQEPWSFYGLSKQLSEHVARYFHRAHALPVTIARFALVAEAPEILAPSGWSGRFLFLSSMRELLEGLGRTDAVAALDASGPPDDETLLLPLDQEGRSYEFQLCDVRDLVEGILRMLHAEAAVGEAFNLSGPSPFSFDEAVTYLHERRGIPYRTVRLPGPRIRVAHSIDKARSLLGYEPVYDIRRIIDSALASPKQATSP
jgi:UDP-glucose 4-epimerase